MSTHHTVRLPGECSLRTIRTLRDAIAAALTEADHLEIDGTDAEQVDLSFVQLITSAARTARREGKPLRVVNLSGAARTAFARAGLPAPDPYAIAS